MGGVDLQDLAPGANMEKRARRRRARTRAVPRNHEKKGSEGRARRRTQAGLTPVKDGNAALQFLDR